MPIQFACPFCGARTDVDDQYAGQTGPCSRCGASITVPTAAAARLADIYQPEEPPRRRATFVIPILMGLVLILMCGGGAMALLYPVYNARTQLTNQQTQCAATLRMIGLAMHNYHDLHGAFPPAVTFDEQRRPKHSWRVLLLPHMQQQDLYNRYDLNQPWDSPQNSQLQAEIGEVYRCPHANHAPQSGLTDFVLLTGPNTLFVDDLSPQISDIQDGSSNTILAVEVFQSDIMATEPRDLTVADLFQQQNNTLPNGAATIHLGQVHVLMADGRVVAFQVPLQQYDLQSMATPAGGEVVNVPR